MVILDEIKSIKSGRGELRKFGISFGIVLAILGSLWLWRGKPFYFYFYIGSGFFLASAFIIPVVLKPVHFLLASLLVIVRVLLTYFMLFVAFYLVFTPIGMIARIFGRDMLHERIDKSSTSYWIPKQHKAAKPEDYERQF